MDFETLATGYRFGEAPRVVDDGNVFFSDLAGGGYYVRHPDGTFDTVLAGRRWIGGAVLCDDGSVVCSGEGGLMQVNIVTGDTRDLLTEIDGVPIVAVNDIEADGRGGLYGGTVDAPAIFERGEPPSPGLFFHLARSGEVVVLRDDVTVSNGIGFSPDGKSLYHNESTVGIWVWALDDAGVPYDRALLAPLEDCDGLAVDSDGGIWVACWQKAEIRRYTPGGSLERTLVLPFPHVTSLAFGGPDLSQLYATTAGDDAHPDMGGVIRIQTDVTGLRAYEACFRWPSLNEGMM